jgi:hypothetical protein
MSKILPKVGESQEKSSRRENCVPRLGELQIHFPKGFGYSKEVRRSTLESPHLLTPGSGRENIREPTYAQEPAGKVERK